MPIFFSLSVDRGYLPYDIHVLGGQTLNLADRIWLHYFDTVLRSDIFGQVTAADVMATPTKVDDFKSITFVPNYLVGSTTYSMATHGVLLKRLLAVASSLLVIYGVALIGYGILYWLMGFPYPVVGLLAFSAYGSFLAGVGLFVRLPGTTRILVLATAAFSLSAAPMIIVNVMSPAAIVLVVIAVAGALASYLRLLMHKRKSR